MCSIVGSFSRDRLRELIELNSGRGETAHSVFAINPLSDHSLKFMAFYGYGLFKDFAKLPADYYYVAHHQAPTSIFSGRHPASFDDVKLFHNGIVKAHTIKDMQKRLDSHAEWDTELLCQDIAMNGFKSLSDVVGSFACVALKGTDVFCFRNTLAPLYLNWKTLDLSSVDAPGMEAVRPHVVYRLDLLEKRAVRHTTFENRYQEFFFGDETDASKVD